MPTPLSEQLPDAFTAWYEQGGAEAAFERHLRLSEQIPSTPDDCLRLGAEAVDTMGKTLALLLRLRA